MNWLNLPVSLSRSPEYIGADKDQRSTWFSLINYCAEQENGGTITNCRRWKSRQWEQSCAVTSDEVARECDLFWWDGDDLNVAFYPIGREKQVKDGRAGGLKGGRPRKPQNPSENPSENPPTEEGKAPQKPEEKIREGKIREEKITQSARGARVECEQEALRLVSLYPKKFKQDDALKELTRQLAAGEVDPEEVEAGTRRIVDVINHIPSGVLNRYVPGTFAFFHGKRWQDDPQTWIRETNHLTNGGRIEQMEFNGRKPAEIITFP